MRQGAYFFFVQNKTLIFTKKGTITETVTVTKNLIIYGECSVNMREFATISIHRIALTVSLTSIPQIKALWCGIFDVQFIDSVKRGSVGNT